MTKKWFEYDQNRQILAVRTWTKLTTINVNLLHLTENDWIWPKFKNLKNITTLTKIHLMNLTEYLILGHNHLFILVVVVKLMYLFYFRSNLTRHGHRCDNFYFKFRSSSSSECSSLSVFVQVQRFWSYSFGHIDSVMWITLPFFTFW